MNGSRQIQVTAPVSYGVMGKKGRRDAIPERRGSTNEREEVLRADQGRNDLTKALDDYRAGFKELHEAAQEAGIPEWDLLEAAQSTPDPLVAGAKPALSDLPAFVRRRDD